MKKIFKKILLFLGILLITLIIMFTGVFLKLRSELKKMTPIESGKIIDEIYVLRDSIVNVYLYPLDSGYLMIDAGADKENFRKELADLNIAIDEVKAIFLTHSDYDHVAALPLFEDAVVYLSRQEEQMINGQQRRMIFQYNEIATDEYTLLNDNQRIYFGDVSIRAIQTPGHTPGAMCYLINDRFLFTGDALSLKDGLVYEFMKLATMDMDTHRKSIQKISDLENIEYVFTAHHGMSDDYDYAFNEWDSQK